MLDTIGVLPEDLGQAQTLLADSGYFSAADVQACEAAGIEPLIALGREMHHPALDERYAATPPAPENPTPVEAMAHRLRTPAGRARYALRKQTPEPVFGIIKSVLGFRPFLRRGLDAVCGEWSLVTMAWTLKRMFALSLAACGQRGIPPPKRRQPPACRAAPRASRDAAKWLSALASG